MSKKLSIALVVLILAFFFAPFMNFQVVNAANSFDQNKVIDDGVFNSATMSASQIDGWINSSFGSASCISTSHGFTAPDPIGYNPTQGFLYGSPVSAGTVIYDAAQAYNINPQVILTTLQKEEGIVVGNGPYGCGALAISASAGYACTDSDTASHTYTYTNGTDPGTLSTPLFYLNGSPVNSVTNTCVNSPLKAGFTEQVIRAAWLLKFGEQRSEGNINWAVVKGNWDNSDDPQSCYGGPMTQGTWQRCPSGGSAYYDGYTTIDGTSVHMDTGSTAALYWYTPHLSGNQSFYNIFTGWFGPTTNAELYYAVIQDPNSTALYLQTSAGKYYLPSGAIMQDWGLDKLPINQVSQAYFDSLPTHDWVGHLLKDTWGNMFIVEGGNLHYVRDASYLPLWNLDPNTAVQSLGITRTLPSTTWAGRFVQDASQPSGPIYLMDKGHKHLVPDGNMLYEWRYTNDQLTTLSTNFLSGLPSGSDVTQYASDGSNSYLVDSGQKLVFSNADIQNAYFGIQTPVSYDSSTLLFLPKVAANQFVVNTTNGQWFMLENNKKHYISTGNIAAVWGKTSSTPLTSVSSGFLATLTDAGQLTYVVQTASPSQYWLVDGSKHYIPTSDVANAWLTPNTSPPVYSNQSLDLLQQGSNATYTVNATGSPYTYMMDNGVRHYLMASSAISAWGGTVLTISPYLLTSIPESSFVNYLAQNSTGQVYLLMNNTAYAIDPSFNDAWGAPNGAPLVGDQTISRYTLSGNTLKAFISIGGTNYIMSKGLRVPVNRFADTYLLPNISNPVSLPANFFSTASDASYLIRSADANDGRMWFMNQGKKLLLTKFEQQVTYGYLSQGVQPTQLSPATLNLIPDDTSAFSLLLQKPNSGIKLISFGSALGFPDSDTLLNYIGSSNQILQVSPSVFDSFILRRSTSRLIEDDYGNYFWMESGSRRHILNWSILQRYQSTPVTYLQGTTMNLIPWGAEINQ